MTVENISWSISTKECCRPRNGKQCRSRSVGFFRSQLIWIYTVCKCRVYPGSAGQGLKEKQLLQTLARLSLRKFLPVYPDSLDWVLFIYTLGKGIWAIMSENIPSDMPSRFRSACTFLQPDQNLHWAYFGQPRMQKLFMQKMKTLIRLHGCAGWSESSFGAHISRYDFSSCSSPQWRGTNTMWYLTYWVIDWWRAPTSFCLCSIDTNGNFTCSWTQFLVKTSVCSYPKVILGHFHL